MTSDPNGPPHPDSGYFGLDDVSGRIVILPVPFEATVSYGEGTADGPEAMRRASHQVDLCDADVGDLHKGGIVTDRSLLPARAWSDAVRPRARRVIESQAQGLAPESVDLEIVNATSLQLEKAVHKSVSRILEHPEPLLPVVLGGDHSVPLGAFRAAAERFPGLGVLQIDAHADLRPAFEGFHQSHASIMHNLRSACPEVPITVVGLRDFSPDERDVIDRDEQITAWFDRDLRLDRLDGRIRETMRRVVEGLPPSVWISCDIDGLDPALCPHTGTPVPGGLGWDEMLVLVEALSTSGRTIRGVDLVEVSPGRGAPSDRDSWDAVVGARLLYKLAGYAIRSHRPERGLPPLGGSPILRS